MQFTVNYYFQVNYFALYAAMQSSREKKYKSCR